MIDMDELTRMGWALVDLDVARLQDQGDCGMQFCVVTPDGGQILVLAESPEIINSMDMKNRIARKVRRMVRDHNAIAVLTTSDAWYSKQTGVLDTRQEVYETIRRIGLVEASKRGLCKKSEAIMCNIVTPTTNKTLFAPYVRDGDKIVMLDRDQIEGRGEGRFASWFDHWGKA
jgi:hypothetical protein